MRKPAIKSINFIKAICAIGIAAYHFACHLSSRDITVFFGYATGSLAGVFVSVFFIVSGALLYYHYEDELKLPQYYFKRWKSIYPMFYLAFGFYWLRNVLHFRTPFYLGSPFSYIYTLLGVDGYLSGRINTYYILGEWFLGAIIILYVLFPFLRLLFNKNKVITFMGVACIYLLFLDKPITNNVGFWTISSCLCSFACGMMLMAYRKYVMSTIGASISLLAVLILYFVKLPISGNLSQHLMAVPMYILLSVVGEWLMKNQILDTVFTRLGKLSYPIFLIHHRVILEVLAHWHPSHPVKIAVLLLLTLGVIIIGAQLLSWVTDILVKKVPAWLSKKKEEKQAAKKEPLKERT